LPFNFNGLTINTHKEVYDPAEDTFLLIESIKIKENHKVFEIGTGCGIIALYCSMKGANVVCSDINPYAIETTYYNYRINRKNLTGKFELRQGSLFEILKSNELFDIIIFNPPYLPTRKNELVRESEWFNKSVNGGFDGLDLIDVFVKKVDNYLVKKGYAFFIFSSLSNREKLDKIISKSKMKSSIINRMKFDFEQLDVYCLKKE
jgi:release factor glutamine methyltransferase